MKTIDWILFSSNFNAPERFLVKKHVVSRTRKKRNNPKFQSREIKMDVRAHEKKEIEAKELEQCVTDRDFQFIKGLGGADKITSELLNSNTLKGLDALDRSTNERRFGRNEFEYPPPKRYDSFEQK